MRVIFIALGMAARLPFLPAAVAPGPACLCYTARDGQVAVRAYGVPQAYKIDLRKELEGCSCQRRQRLTPMPDAPTAPAQCHLVYLRPARLSPCPIERHPARSRERP